jgi:hypothetical protein
MPRVCFEEKPQINTFYDDVEVCKRGGKKKKKAKATYSNVNKVIVNLTQGNRRRMTAPARTFANPPKALQSISYSNPIAPSHFSNAPINTHNEPMKIFKDTVEEKVRDSIPTFRALENPTGLCPADTNARRVIPSRIQSGGVLSSAPIVRLAQDTLDKARDVLRMNPSYFPPTGSASNLPKPYPGQEEIARPSNFVPLVAAQPEPREVQMQRLGTKMNVDYKIRTPVPGDPSSRIKQKMLYVERQGKEIPRWQPLAPPGERTQSYLTSKKPDEGKEEKEPSKKRGGSVF